LNISGLTNPLDTETISGLEVVYIQSQKESEYSVYVDYTNILPAPISVVVSPDSELANSIDVSYTWIFTLSNDLEEDASILLTYPENDYVLTTTPSP